MADEPISFQVSDNGTTEALTNLVEALGQAGGQAFDNLTAAQGRFVQGSEAAQAAQELMNQYIAAGGSQIEKVGALFQSMTAEQMEAAGASREVTTALQNLGVAEQAVAQRAREAQQAVEAQNAAFAANVQEAAAAAQELQRWSAGAQNGTSVALAYREAHTSAAAATTAAGNAAGAAGPKYTALGGAIQTLTGYFGAYIAASKILKDVDAVDSITQQLNAVVPAGASADEIFSKLNATAIATQQPLETVAKNFTQIYSSIKEGGGTVDQATGAVDALTKALYDTGTKGQAAQRVIHDFTEGLASGALNGRQLTSALMQAPAVMELFSQALGKNVESLTTHALATERAEDKLSSMKAAAQSNQETVAKASEAYKTSENAVTRLTATLKSEEDRLNTLKTTRGNHTAAIKTEEAEIAKNEAALRKEQQAVTDNAKQLGSAKAAQEENTQAKIKAQEATVANMTALDKETVLGVLNGQKMKDILDKLAQTATGTVSGAFTALNDKFLGYLKTTGDASTITYAFNVALGLVGNSIPVLVPALAALAAAFAFLKIKAIIVDLYDFATAEKTVAAATAILDLAMNPWVAVAVLITAAVVGLITYFNQWGTVMTALQAIWSATVATWQTVTDLLTAAWAGFINTIQPLINFIMPQWNKLVAEANETWNKLKAVVNDLTSTISGALSDAIKNNQELFTTLGKIINSIMDNAITPLIKLFVTGIGVTAVAGIEALLGILQTVITVVNAIIAVVQKAIDLFKELASLGGGGGAGAGAGASRDGSSFDGSAYIGRSAAGSSFTVPGSSGVDSRVMMVSPGEHVTVQTPEQYKNGKVNDSMPKFRDGGTLDLDGIQAAFTAAGDNSSVTGFSAVTDTDYYTNSAGTVYSANSLKAQAAAAAAAKAAADAAAAAQAAAQQMANSGTTSAANDNAGSTTQTGGYAGGGVQGGIDQTAQDAQDKAAQQQRAKAYAIQQDELALQDAETIVKSGGTDKPTSDLMSLQQAQNWVDVNGSFVPRPGSITETKGNVQEAYAKLKYDQNTPYQNFRDGGSMIVPGSSGVDSRMITLAVSPGEQLSVKTPQQQQVDRDQDNSASPQLQQGATVIFNVKSDDANSFRKSRSQMASDLKRQLAKVS